MTFSLEQVNRSALAVVGLIVAMGLQAGVSFGADDFFRPKSKFRAELFAAGVEFEWTPNPRFYCNAGATYGATARMYAQAGYGILKGEASELRLGADISYACICLFMCPYYAICEPSVGLNLSLELERAGFHFRYPLGQYPIPAGIIGFTWRFQ